MPLKIVAKKTIRDLETAVAYYDRAIENIRSFRKAGGWKNAIMVLKEVRDELGKAVAGNLANPNHVRILRSVGYAGEQRGLQKAIDIFEDPESQLDFYKSQKKLAQDALKTYTELPKSDN